jgi:cold shock CspA family protein
MNVFKQFFMDLESRNKESSKLEHNIQPAVPNGINDKKEEIKIDGKIIKVSEDGWGFIITKEIPFTRIFFHWTSLVQDTMKFTDLRRGMKVEFVPVDKGDRGYHAIKIKVMEE